MTNGFVYLKFKTTAF